MKCPNKSSKEWKDIVAKYGEDIAWASYIRNGEDIPPLSYVDNLLSSNASLNNNESNKNYIKNVKNAIEEQLTSMSLGIGVLDEYEKRVGIKNESFDPTIARKEGDSLTRIIKIAKDTERDLSLPEESAHLVDIALLNKDNALYNRFVKLLKDENILKEVFEQEEVGSYNRYYKLYNGNKELLESEARAKLINKYIFKNEEINSSPWQSLFQRVKTLFSNVFKKGDESTLNKKIIEADYDFGKFTAKLLDGEVKVNLDLNSINNKRVISNVKSTLSKSEELLKKIIEVEHKKLKIAESNKRLTEEQRDILNQRNINLNRLEVLKNQKDFNQGILNFISQAYDDMSSLISKLDDLKNSKVSDINIIKTSKFLRDLKSYINAYSPLLEDIIRFSNSQEYKENSLIDLSEPIKDLIVVINMANVQYKEAALPLFAQFIKPYTSKLVGKKIKGVKVTEEYINDIINESEKDIGVLDRWLFSMAESSDLMLRLIERPVKNSRFKAKEKTDETIRQLQKAQEDLEKAGFNTEFMYERDKNGKLTGKYIQEIDWSKFYDAQNEKQEELTKKYGDRRNSSDWWKEFYKWRNLNMTVENNKWVPKKELYSNKVFSSLKPAQRKFYDKIISIKTELDLLLPENKMNPYLLPQVRKDFLERLKSADSLKEAKKLFISGIEDKWVSRESDDEFGVRFKLQDFDGTKLDVLPVYYTTKLNDMDQLSTDIVSSMALFADMAYNYDAMNKIVDIMEIGKDIMSNRQIDATIGTKNVVEKFQHGGRTIMNKVIKPKGNSNFIDRLESFYDAQIYGKTQKDQGTIKIPFIDSQISVAKTVNNINQLTALNTYALNLLSGVANVTMGRIMARIEAVSGQYFNVKDLVWADKTYASQLPSVLGQLGKRRKTDKLDLLMIKFNVLQDHEKAIREIEMNKKNIFARLCNSSAFFFLNNCGEHYMQTRTFLALANEFKLKDSSGKEINLWDAYEVKVGKDGIERVEIKDGVTKLDGTAFTSDDVEKLSRKSARINQKLHGIYNKEDMNAFQTTAQGRLVMMFRKWIVPSFNRRFQGENYSFDLEDTEQGYYNYTVDFFKLLYNDLKKHQFNLSTRWKELDKSQRANLLRAATEVGHFIAIMLSYIVLSSNWDGDDDWYKSFTLYQMRRLQTELGALIPGPQILNEGLTLLNSPAPGINYLQNVMNILNITSWTDDPIESGQYKGWNKGVRNVVRIVPFNNTIRRALSPDESLKFYTTPR